MALLPTLTRLSIVLRGDSLDLTGAFDLTPPVVSLLRNWFDGALATDAIRLLTAQLASATSVLADAIVHDQPGGAGAGASSTSFTRALTRPSTSEGVTQMVNPVLADLATSVTNTVGVMQSATTLINGISARLAAAIAAALANGATAEELAPVQAEKDALDAGAAALAQAVATDSGGVPNS